MKTTRTAIIVLALYTVECGAEEEDLPEGWAGAVSLPVDHASCDSQTVMPGAGRLTLMRDMGRLRATYENAQFRCEQRLCAYRREETGGTRVLVQPCDMSPNAVPRCDCLYRVGFDLPGVEAGRTVELHRRWDRYGATSEPPALLVDSERAP